MASFVQFIIFFIVISTSISAINATSKTFNFKFSSASTSTSLTNVIIQLKKSGYKSLAYALQLNYEELVALKNMTIFALNDFSININKSENKYLEDVKFHIIPNRLLKFAYLEKLPEFCALPTLSRGENLYITTSAGGSGGDFSQMKSMRVNYVPMEYPNLLYNAKVVVHGISFPFGHITVLDSSICPITNDDGGEFGYDDNTHDEL